MTDILIPSYQDSDIKNIVNKIINQTGINQAFIVVSIPNFNNCSAFTYYGRRVIAYDPVFLKKISNNNIPIITSIIAHEIAHHIYNHTLYKSLDNEEQRKRELEADYFSGLIMRKLGYGLNQAINGVEKLDDLPSDEYETHPLREKRILIITEAFEKTANDVEFYIKNLIRIDKDNAVRILDYKNYNRGMAFLEENSYQKAINELKKVSQKANFIYLSALVNSSEAYKELNNTKDALTNLLVFEKNIPNDNFLNKIPVQTKNELIANHIYFNIAGIYDMMGQQNSALNYYLKAYNYLPNDFLLTAKIGMLYQELNNSTNAYEFFQLNNSIEKFAAENFSPSLLGRYSTNFVLSSLNKRDNRTLYNELLKNYYHRLDEKDKQKLIFLMTEYYIKQVSQNKLAEYEVNIFNLYQKSKNLPPTKLKKIYLDNLEAFYNKFSFLFPHSKLIISQIHDTL